MPQPANGVGADSTEPAYAATYEPCRYCGGMSACSCPVPSAPMEGRFFEANAELAKYSPSSYTPRTWLFVLDPIQEAN